LTNVFWESFFIGLAKLAFLLAEVSYLHGDLLRPCSNGFIGFAGGVVVLISFVF